MQVGTRVVTKINGHRDKRPSNLSNLNIIKYKIAQLLNNNIYINNAYHNIWFVLYCSLKPFNRFCVMIYEDCLSL